jgi:hypothetical protein
VKLKSRFRILLLITIITIAGMISSLKATIPIVCHGDESCLRGHWQEWSCLGYQCYGDPEIERTCMRCMLGW